MKTLVWFLPFLLFTFSAVGQKTVWVKGTVFDKKTDEPLLGANVALVKATIGTTTDLGGYFEFGLAAEKFPDTLTVSYLGYKTIRHPLTEAAADTLTFTFALIAAETSDLGEVVVRARLPIAEDFVVNKMSFLDIVLNPSSSADPLLAVRSLPSSTTTSESASISLRGSNASQTGVFLNEVPIYDAVKFAQLSGIGTFSLFNVNLIRNVLVFPSSPPLEYGNVGAGLIALTTDDKQRDRFGELSVGLAQSGFLAGGFDRQVCAAPFDQRHIVNANLEWNIGAPDKAFLPALVQLTYRHETGRPFTPVVGAVQQNGVWYPVRGDINSRRLASYDNLNLRIEWRQAMKGTRVFKSYIETWNVLNARNPISARTRYGDEYPNNVNQSFNYAYGRLVGGGFAYSF